MKGLVFGGITPHGPIIKEIAGDEFNLYKTTGDAMEELGRNLKKHNPDTIVILTPHGLRLKGYNAIYTCDYCSGSLTEEGSTIYAEFKCDRPMAEEILKKAIALGVPCVGANYGSLSGRGSDVPMDWGTLIPLWYMGARDETRPEIVVVTPTRDIPLEQLVTLGKAIGEAAEKSGKRTAIIASADQAHTHDSKGIYGYDRAAKEYDDQIISIVRENRLSELLHVDMELVERAKPDSLWQMLILHGALTAVPMEGKLLSYQAPTYFGMLVAEYEPIRNKDS